MKIINTEFEGLFVLQTVNFQDNRGGFQKLFNLDFFKQNGLDTDFQEFYYSVNKKGVRRGMHFQIPPFAHTKLVYVSKGKILDVCVDIRKSSKTYGKCFSIELDDQKAQYLYIPKGFAHGFLTLTDNVNFVYKCDNYYDAEADGGISFKTPELNIDWPIEFDKAITSEKDAAQPTLTEFEKDNPFVYGEI